MTPSQVYSLIRSQFNEPDPDFITESELYQYMSAAELIIAQKTGCTPTTTTDTTVAATKEYTRPSNCIRIERLLYDSVKLKKIGLTEVDVLEGTTYGGTTTSGYPVYYYEYGETIGLSPTPNDAKTLKYYYIEKPTALSASSTAFTIPAEFAQYISDYCLYRMYLKDQMNNEATSHFQIWEKNLMEIETIWRDRMGSDFYRVVKNEDNYPISDFGII